MNNVLKYVKHFQSKNYFEPLTRIDVVPDDVDVLVTIGTRLLVEESQQMHDLVGDRAWSAAP